MEPRPKAISASKRDSASLLDRGARHAVQRRLAQIEQGVVELRDALGRHHFGQGDGLAARCDVRDLRFYRKLLWGGGIGAAESYIDGDWDCDDLVSLLRISVRNWTSSNLGIRGLRQLVALWQRVSHWRRSNTRRGSGLNIASHYDLGNDFFRLWLDESLAYSSGVFPTSHASLHEASLEKFDRICRKLDLHPGDELLEIGCGWGGFALHAAGEYGCRVTATTISREQEKVARERVAAAGLSDRVEVINRDYRDLHGQYDKLVAIEMIEAVGHQYLDTFFAQCSRLLHGDGTMVVQAIVMPEQHHAEYLRSVDFIQRHVFPGGCLPSVASMVAAVGRATNLRLVHAEDFASHYAQTIAHWRERFRRQTLPIAAQGFSPEFMRLWHYYLCYCEAAFRERVIGVMQLQWDKPQRRHDPAMRSNKVASSREHGGNSRSKSTAATVAASYPSAFREAERCLP